MTNKLRIDPIRHRHLSKCEMHDCRKEFNNGDPVYKYNHIYDMDDPYTDCSHIEEEYVFCSKECLLNFILQSSNLKIMEVELYDESKEVMARKNEIRDLLLNMKPDTSIKYNSLNIYCFNRMGKLNYIINNKFKEVVCDSIDKAISYLIKNRR